MEWALGFDPAGSFCESLTSPQMECTWGYDAAATSSLDDPCTSSGSGSPRAIDSSGGGSGSAAGGPGVDVDGVCWAADDAGCPRRLQLDDAEALLLSTWVRTGSWVLPSIAARLEVRAVPRPRSLIPSAGGAEAGSGDAWVELRMRGGCQVAALLEVCTATWRPVSMRLQLAGDEELWQLSDYREWQPGLWAAGTAVQSSSSKGGVVNTYHASSVQVRHSNGAAARSSGNDGSSRGSRFAPPPAPLLPADASFAPGAADEVPAWHTVSGHRWGPAARCPPPCLFHACQPLQAAPPLPALLVQQPPPLHRTSSQLPWAPPPRPLLPTQPTTHLPPPTHNRSLVKPLINGSCPGYFIFDTGASGFVIDPAAAEELGLEAFGELQVTAMVGKVASRFRWAAAGPTHAAAVAAGRRVYAAQVEGEVGAVTEAGNQQRA